MSRRGLLVVGGGVLCVAPSDYVGGLADLTCIVPFFSPSRDTAEDDFPALGAPIKA